MRISAAASASRDEAFAQPDGVDDALHMSWHDSVVRGTQHTARPGDTLLRSEAPARGVLLRRVKEGTGTATGYCWMVAAGGFEPPTKGLWAKEAAELSQVDAPEGTHAPD